MGRTAAPRKKLSIELYFPWSGHREYAAEYFTAVTVTSKNIIDLAIGVAVGSSVIIGEFLLPFQISSISLYDLLTPAIVVLGWESCKEVSRYL